MPTKREIELQEKINQLTIQLKLEQKNSIIPEVRTDITREEILSRIVGFTQQYLNDIAAEDAEDDDASHYIYESLMSALYGEKVWEFINHHLC